MAQGEEPARPEGRRDGTLPLTAVVPTRAVLTELARGFLLVHESDPGHAAQFALTFLRERAEPTPPSCVIAPGHLAVVRRGVATALRENGKR